MMKLRCPTRLICLCLTVIIAVITGFFLTKIGLIKLFAETSELKYLSLYYDNYANKLSRNRKTPFIENHSITIIDAGEYETRKNMPELLKKVYDMSPSVIGLDIIYQYENDADSITNQELLKAIDYCKDKLVVAATYDEYNKEVIRSFFGKHPGVREGLAGVSDFWNYKISDTIEDSTLFLLDYKLAQMYTNSENIPFISGHDLVDFKSVDFFQRGASTIVEDWKVDGDFARKFIKDRIVIIGNNNLMMDSVSLPFSIGNSSNHSSTYISGPLYHAYITNSLVSSECRLHRVSDFWNFLLNLCFIVLYAVVYQFLSSFENKGGWWFKLLMAGSKIFLLVAFELFILWCSCILITDILKWVPNIVLSMITIVFIEYADRIARLLIPKIKCHA